MTLQEGIDTAKRLIIKLQKDYDYEDYKKLKDLSKMSFIDFDDISIKEKNKWLYYQNNFNLFIQNAIKKQYNKNKLSTYSYDEVNFIKDNSYILPLVLANDENKNIVLTGDNRYMFMCQVHKENTPSMAVYDLLNYYYCYGCNKGNNVIGYLMQYEHLKYNETLNLLTQIYLLAINKPDDKLSDIAYKYRKVLLSDKYKELLNLGKKRLKNHVISSRLEFANLNFEEEYNNRYHTIERVSKNIYVEPKLTKK